MLLVQGGRDDLTDLRELRPFLADLGERASLRVVEGADRTPAEPSHPTIVRP